MKSLNDKLLHFKQSVDSDNITIMILGLGSVGTYLLDYLVSRNDSAINLVVVGRNFSKMESDVNIINVASSIRAVNRSTISIEANVNFENVDELTRCIVKYCPDIIVNSSRVYSGLKYGSISWKNVRAYGIWTPLSVKYIRNIMLACDAANTDAIVINTSYSDAVIPWLKSAALPYPDFGSGNGNHLIPRIKFSVAKMLGISDFWNIDVTLATSHFHDVVISKEGQTDGVPQLIQASYNGQILNLDYSQVFMGCKIEMPVDAKRNMMNASSNYEIIISLIDACRTHTKRTVFSPGAFGEVGGYPIVIDGTNNNLQVYFDESVFTLGEMRRKNYESIYLDGIEKIENGKLYYTDEFVHKVKNSFSVDLPKYVDFKDLDSVAQYLIDTIIIPNLNQP